MLDTYYPPFLAEHYRRAPELAARTYDEQLTALIDRCFGTSDAYSRHLRELGHDAVDVVANCEPLQLRWAREHGLAPRTLRALATLPRRVLLRRIALAQISAYEPQVVYVQDLWFFTKRDVAALSAGGRFVVGQIASALPPRRTLDGFDLLVTSLPQFVERFRKHGLDAEYLKIGFDEKVLDRLRDVGVDSSPSSPREYTAAFVGGLGGRIWAKGTRILERAVKEADVDVWGYGAGELSTGSAIRSRYHGEAWGIDMYEILARSRIAFNRHGEVAGGYAANMRLYEATGVGALVVTDATRNLADLFEPGREIVAYESEDDAVDKLRHYAAHDDERRRIAAAGQARTLREHTYSNRMRELSAMLEARLA